MPHHVDLVAPRREGGLARYRVYPQMVPPLGVDTDRALAAINDLGRFNASYKWSSRFFQTFAAALLVAGVVGAALWHWWVILVGFFLAYATWRAVPQSAADFVCEIVRAHPEQRTRFVAAGIVCEDLADLAGRAQTPVAR